MLADIRSCQHPCVVSTKFWVCHCSVHCPCTEQVLFYLSDVALGGETVFPKGEAVDYGSLEDLGDGVTVSSGAYRDTWMVLQSASYRACACAVLTRSAKATGSRDLRRKFLGGSFIFLLHSNVTVFFPWPPRIFPRLPPLLFASGARLSRSA